LLKACQASSRAPAVDRRSPPALGRDQTMVTLHRSGVGDHFLSNKFSLSPLAEHQIVDLGVVGSNPASHPKAFFLAAGHARAE
jgi:hypothetical protein